MNNRIQELFAKKKENVLNVYFTAGHPGLNDTADIISLLAEHGADLVEIGMPYSDPLADGPTIQASSQKALESGMHLDLMFRQITDARTRTDIPFIMMGYLNQVMQYGTERFLASAQKAGVDGLIIPDLPMDIYEEEYQALFQKYGLTISFLVSPQTSDDRIRLADRLSSAFLYVVSQSSITGTDGSVNDAQQTYFKKIQSMKLQTPQLIGFGIHDSATFRNACQFSGGAIIGSAFIRCLEKEGTLEEKVSGFLDGVLE